MLQMSKQQLYSYDNANCEELIAYVRPVLAHRRELYERYSRKSSKADMMDSEKKVKIPFEFYITKMAKGYLAGKSPTYSISGIGKSEGCLEKFTESIDYIRRYNDDGALYSDLMHDYLTTSAAYIYIYENDVNEIVYARLDSRQTAGIFDYSVPPNIIGAVRIWSETSADKSVREVCEIITDKSRIKIIDNNIIENEQLMWGDVPCAAMEETDGIAVYEPAMCCIDKFEQILSNITSMTQYNDNAKLLLKNYTLPMMTILNGNSETIPNPEYETMVDKLYKAKTLAVGVDGDISWLLKNIEYTGLLDVLRQLHELITMLTGVPNMTDEAFSNADNASALGYKLYSLDQYSADTDRIFRRGYMRIWEIITGRLNLRGGTYDFRDINISMQRNIPTDRDKSIDRAVKMKSSGLFSDETAISESQVEVFPAEEMARRNAETEHEYSIMQKHDAVDTDNGNGDE